MRIQKNLHVLNKENNVSKEKIHSGEAVDVDDSFKLFEGSLDSTAFACSVVSIAGFMFFVHVFLAHSFVSFGWLSVFVVFGLLAGYLRGLFNKATSYKGDPLLRISKLEDKIKEVQLVLKADKV